MSWQPIARERYDAMVESHHREPGNIKAAALAAQANWRTAKRAWEVGYPRQKLPAIRDLLAQEDKIRRGLVADALDAQNAEAERVRAELVAVGQSAQDDVQAMMKRLATLEGQLRQQSAELDAKAKAVEDAAKRQRNSIITRGETGAEAAKQQGLLWAGNLRNYSMLVLEILGRALTPEAVLNISAKLGSLAASGDLPEKEALALTRTLVTFMKPMAETFKITGEGERAAGGIPTHVSRLDVVVSSDDDLVAMARENLRLLKRAGIDVEDAELEVPPIDAPVDASIGGETEQETSTHLLEGTPADALSTDQDAPGAEVAEVAAEGGHTPNGS